jgi:hypothetical protein
VIASDSDAMSEPDGAFVTIAEAARRGALRSGVSSHKDKKGVTP